MGVCVLTYLGICYVGFFIIFRSYIVDKNCQLCNCKKKRIRNHMVNTEKMDTTKLRPAQHSQQCVHCPRKSLSQLLNISIGSYFLGYCYRVTGLLVGRHLGLDQSWKKGHHLRRPPLLLLLTRNRRLATSKHSSCIQLRRPPSIVLVVVSVGGTAPSFVGQWLPTEIQQYIH